MIQRRISELMFIWFIRYLYECDTLVFKAEMDGYGNRCITGEHV